MSICVIGQIFTNISDEFAAFIFRVLFYYAIQRHISGDSTVHNHQCGNFKYYTKCIT
jgi:hypothetical protein